MAMKQDAQQEQHDIYDLGLQADLAMFTRKPIERRRILKMGLLGIGVLLAGCGASTATPTTTTSTGTSAPASAAASAVANTASAASTTASTASTAAVVSEIPQETAGPYPADGSQASSKVLNALTLSGIVRRDIRTSLGTGNVAPGIPATLELTLVNTKNNGAPLAGYAMYLWHCDRAGNYSLYSNGVTGEDYLRGVQVADSNGKITFTSIFPACYAGRWPHAHFEVYPSLEKATAASNAIHTSQLAYPEDVCKAVYATTGYEQSVKNLSQVTLDTDNVFSDGHSLQVATVTGDPTTGYTVRLTIGIDA